MGGGRSLVTGSLDGTEVKLVVRPQLRDDLTVKYHGTKFPQRRELMKSLACNQRNDNDYQLFNKERAAINLKLI